VLAGIGVALLLRQLGDTSGGGSQNSDAAAGEAAATALGDGRGDASRGGDGSTDDELEVKELVLGDADNVEWNQKSIRVMHPDPRVQGRLREWLEPREKSAIAANASLSCNADTATRTLISLTCVSLAKSDLEDAAPGEQGSSPNPIYASLTLHVASDAVKALALADVLRPGIGEKEVVEACRKVADPPFACVWPPTSFSIVRGDSLYICHDHNCVDIDEEAGLLRPDLTVPLAH
jgi:hypothetical protein